MSEVNTIFPDDHKLGAFNIKWSFEMEDKLFHDMYPILISTPENHWEIHVHYAHLPNLKEIIIETVENEEPDEADS